MKKNINEMMNKTVELLNIPSPSGYTFAAIDFVDNFFKSLGIKTKKTIKGALIATIPGEDNSNAYTLSAHVDTLGAMVKEIKSDGRIKLTQVGGYTWNSVEGENCIVHASNNNTYNGTILLHQASVHVYSSKASETKRSEDNMEIRLDEVVKNSEDVEKLGICVGDFVSFDSRTQYLESGYLKSRHLDDKACVGILMAVANHIVSEKISLPHDLNFFISNYEEVGHGASSGIPENTVEFIAVDMAAPGDGQTSDEQKVTICAKDSSGPYDYILKEKMVSLAKENKLDYSIDIYPSYGSDASAAMRSGANVRHGLIGPGVDSSQAYERTHVDAMKASVDLCVALVQQEIKK